MPDEEKTREVTITSQQIAELLKQEKINSRQIKSQLNQMLAVISELNASIQTIKEIEGKKDFQILVPLGSGLYISAKAENSEKIKTTLPGNVILEKSPKETIDLLAKEQEIVKKQLEALQNSLKQSSSKIKELSGIINLAQQQMKKQRMQKPKD